MWSNLWHRYKIPFLLAAAIFISIWPISFHLFLPKWDNIDCYLPYKYFWSDAVWNGHWPWWNPYEYLGLPAYSDMQNGMFSPITWGIVLLFGKYTTISLAIEITFYYLLAGLGMYKFIGLFEQNKSLRFFIGFSYALSGFMLGTSQIMIFIMGAAWLPWVLYYVIQLHKKFNTQNALLLGVFISLEITSASPAYSIVLAYLMAGYILYKWIFSDSRLFQIIKYYGIVGLVILTTCLPFIAGVIDFIPYFSRLEKLDYTPWVYEGSFDFAEYISFLFPYLTIHDSDFFGSSSISLRNGYIGVIALLIAGISLWNWRSNFRMKAKLLALTVLFLVLAAGDHTPFYKLFYELPGFGNFRHPSFFRAHALFFLFIIAALGFQHISLNQRLLKVGTYGILGIGILAAMWGIGNTSITEISDLFSSIMSFEELPKYTVFAFWFVAGISLVFIQGVLFLTQKKTGWSKGLIIAGLLDILIHAHLVFPNTVILPPNYTQANQMNAFQNFPDIINQEPLKTPLQLIQKQHAAFENTPIWRNQSTFIKTITPEGHNATQFKSFNQLEENGGLERLTENTLLYPVHYSFNSLEEVNKSHSIWNTDKAYSKQIEIKNDSIQQNEFVFTVKNKSDTSGMVILVQNFHHGWSVQYENRITKPQKVNDGVIGVEIPPNYEGKVALIFKAPWIKSATIFSMISWLLLPLILWTSRKKLLKVLLQTNQVLL